MSPTRRKFMRQLGIALASMMAVRCTSKKDKDDPQVTCYIVAPITPEPGSTATLDQQADALDDSTVRGDLDRTTVRQAQAAIARDRLLACWLRFDWLAEESRQGDVSRGQKAQDQLLSDHRTALDALVALDELDAEVSDEVQVAFEAAVYHVWRSNVPMTCYKGAFIDYTPASSGQLVQQASLLSEIAAEGDVDADTMAQIQTAIERDVTFLNLPADRVASLYAEIEPLARDEGQPSFDEIDLDLDPVAVQAARFLVDLLLPGAE
jgi:hypothetical protein